MLADAATAVTAPATQVVDAPGTAATLMPVGRASESVRLESARLPVPVLASVVVTIEDALGEMDVGEKAVLSVMFGAEVTVRLAVETALVAPCVVVSAPAAIVFV